MKNLAKIFMMVAALFAFACTTDVTEDLGVQLGDGAGQTTITLSLEESRTQLGEKVGELYPLYWSEGDAIAANGFASNPIADEWVGKSGATFTFAENLSHPYHIVYPAPAEGVKAVTEGCYPVVFPAVQKYVAGNIDGAAAVMYGYAEEGSVPTLNHLTGILRFAVKGDVTLASMVVTAEKGALSGTYDVNCATGALTVQEGSTGNSVSVSFGEGLKLSAEEASLIHVAVPAGEYGAVRAVLTTTDGKKMTLKFDSNAKPIAAATIRDFKPFTFVENALDGDIFEIYDVEDLLMFAKTAASFPWSEAKLMNDINMTGVEWSAAEGFAKVFNGNNKTIKGLSAPLFGTTCAQIKDLTLTDVALTSNGKLIMGSIACLLTSGGQEVKASLTNCKAVGTLTISNPEWQPTSDQSKNVDAVNYGGLVGRALGADITNCTNQVAVTVEQMTIENNTVVLYPSVAGVVGYVNKTTLSGGEEVVTTITSTNNDAAVSYECTANASDKALIVRPYLAGVVGRCHDSGNTVLEDCQNTAKGAITLNSSTYGAAGAAGGTMIGGVISRARNVTVKNCDNYGKVTVDNRHFALVVGGVAGFIYSGKTENCDNFGAIEIKETTRIRGIAVGGAIGITYGYASSAEDQYAKLCTNNAPITIAASTDEKYEEITDALYYRIGGVTGFAQTHTFDLTNNADGDITLSGDIVVHTTATERSVAISGVVPFKTNKTAGGYNKNYADITVKTNFTYSSEAVAALHAINVGGVFCGCGGNPSGEGNLNEGTITFDGSIDETGFYLAVAGVVGGTDNYKNITALKPLLNKGEVVIGENAVIKVPCYVGGVFARNEDLRASYERIGNKNEGNVTVKGTITGNTYIGGLGGHFNIKCTDSTNSGVITLDEKASVTGDLYIGGIAGYSVQTLPITGLKNSGAVKVDGDVTGNVYIGGVYGTTTAVITGASNTGAVTYSDKASVSGTLNIGGILGASTSTEEIADLSNGGAVSVNGPVPGILYLGGIFGTGSIIATGANSTSTASVSVGSTATLTGNAYVGGLIGKYDLTSEITGLSNGGSVSVDCAVPGKLYLGGVLGHSSILATSATNSGAVTVGINSNLADDLYVGGVLGYNNSTSAVSGLNNSGDVSINGTLNYDAAHTVRLAGVIGYGTKSSLTDVINTGNVEFGGSISSTSAGGTIYIGGVACHMAGAALTNVTNGAVGADGTPLNDKGNVIMSGTMPNKSNNNLHMGGVIANLYNAFNVDLKTVRNYGDIKLTETGVCGYSLYIGGITECAVNAGKTYDDCINAGDILIDGMVYYNAFMGGITYQANKVGTYKNCHNKGNIVFGESSSIKGRPNYGGFAGNITSSPIFDGCSNSGNISFNGTHNKYGYLRFGGIGGYVSTAATGKITIKNGFTNSGNMSVGGSSKDENAIGFGGLFGSITCPIVVEGEGEVKNTGTISFTGQTNKGLYMGGIAGISSVAITAPVINVGNLTCEGEATAETAIGGIVGLSEAGGVTGAQCFCNIKAMGYNAGMIMGVARTDAIKATNCKVGGSLVYTIGEIMVDPGNPDEGVGPTYKDGDLPGELNSSNWFECIYSKAVDKAVAEGDGCSLLTEKPTVPTPTVQ